jgi:hypothetical protein
MLNKLTYKSTALFYVLIRPDRLCIFDYACGFKHCIAEVKDEKPQHERDRIPAIDENIGDHYAGIKEKLDYDGQKKSVNEFNKPFLCRLKQIIKGEQ